MMGSTVNYIDHVFPHIHTEMKNAQPVLDRYCFSVRDIIDLCGGIPTRHITNIRVTICATYSTALSAQVVTDQYEVARNMDFEIGRIDNNYMYVEQKNQGIGTSLFLTQIRTARKFNFKKIHLTAMGPEDGLDWRGYYFWAELGFENTDIDEYKTWAAEMGRNEPTLSELMQTKTGRELWKNTGFTWIGNFHLAKDHPRSEYLRKYLQRKKLDFDLEN